MRKYRLNILLFAAFAAFFLWTLPKNILHPLKSANLTSVSVTMSTSRLSYRALLNSSNSAGSSLVTIQTSGAPSVSTANLFTGDTVWIGNATTGTDYTVDDITSSSQFQITSALGSGDADNNDHVIASRSASLTVRFTSATAVANGAFRVLVPGADNTVNSYDGIPDHTGFDFSGSTPTVTCPNDVSSTFDFVTGTASAAAVTIGSVTYHAYTCRYSGAGGVGEAFNGSNDQIVISNVINPAATNGHSEGTADQYRILVQQLNGSAGGDTAIDATTASVAAIESVRVTATVNSSLQFTIAGIAASQSYCGITTDVTTTATAVPLGDVGISAFVEGAQTLTVSTNADNGYIVTAIENDQLGLEGVACDDNGTDGYGAGNGCIPDVTGGSETGTGLAWSATSTKGFGYTLDDVDTDVGTADMSVYYNATASSCGGAGTFCARKFADNENAESVATLFSSSTVADSEDVSVCYRAVVSVSQEAGDYENNITYTATATF